MKVRIEEYGFDYAADEISDEFEIKRPDSVKSERSSSQPLPPELLFSSTQMPVGDSPVVSFFDEELCKFRHDHAAVLVPY
jgi:hypothetical protein